MPDYSTWKVVEIQQELKKRGAKNITGRKKDLIDRLVAYDRNNNFKTASAAKIPDEDPMPDFPDISLFRSLHESHRDVIPPIRKEHVVQYVLYRQGHDSHANENVTSMEKGEKMGKNVQGLSFFNSGGSVSSLCFFSGLVGAEMTKGCSYNLKFVISNTGEVRHSHCECAAGIGPHSTCKHIVACLLLVAEFVKTGESNVLKSCTEVLQQFHRPKKTHKGSPKKAESFKTPIVDCGDPRPVHLRNLQGYNDFVTNQTVNFVYQTGLDVGNRYRSTPANLVEAARDHHYLAIPYPLY